MFTVEERLEGSYNPIHPDIRINVSTPILDHMAALADPIRVRMLLPLERHELTVSELTGGWSRGAMAPAGSTAWPSTVSTAGLGSFGR